MLLTGRAVLFRCCFLSWALVGEDKETSSRRMSKGKGEDEHIFGDLQRFQSVETEMLEQ